MPRRPRPAKPMPVETPSRLHRFAVAVADYRILIGAGIALLAATGVAYAYVDSLATKEDVAAITNPIVSHVDAHDKEFQEQKIRAARMEQKQDDILDVVHDIQNRLNHR